ncbi:MAG: response regulator [Lachnospiraceae bacterium]|nr:response regulator [Lachnospiraceae bacterium]
MNILIIDDERPALNMLNDTLKKLCGSDDVIVSFSSAGAFEKYEDKSSFDAAFIDIEIGKVSGIQFALELKKYSPKCNIVFVTSYDKYGTEAYKTRPSGYVLKPYTEEDIKNELENLRYPVENVKKHKKLKVVTFGNFVVYKDNDELLDFTLTRSKELFAYLIDCGGYPVTTSDIAKEVLEKTMDKQISKNLSKIINGMIEDLSNAGYKDIIIKQNRQLQINKSRVECDLFDALRGDVEAINSYHGEYMIDYSWAELTDSANRLRKLMR